MQTSPTQNRPERPDRARNARLIRDGLGLLASKWTVDVLLALGDGSRRYHELLGDLTPISEKVLTQTLRGMERDGLIGRKVHAEVPPRVDYRLTALGLGLAESVCGIWLWVEKHAEDVERSRRAYDAQPSSEG